MRELNRKKGDMVSGGTGKKGGSGGSGGSCPTGDSGVHLGGSGSTGIQVCVPPGSSATITQGNKSITVTGHKGSNSSNGSGFLNDVCTGTLTTAGGLVGGAIGSIADPVTFGGGTVFGGIIGDAAGQTAAQKLCDFSVG